MASKLQKNDQMLLSVRVQTLRNLVINDDFQQNVKEYDKKINASSESPATKLQRFLLKQIIQKKRTKSLVKEFVSRIKRNNIRQKPPIFKQFDQAVDREVSQQSTGIQGFNLPLQIKLSVYILYLIGILISYGLSTFQGFIRKFWQEEASSITVRILKIISTVFIFIFLLLRIISIKTNRGVQIRSLSQITKANLKSFRFYALLANFIVSLLFNLFQTQEIGIILFCITLINLPIVQQIIGTFQTIYADTFYQKQISRLLILFFFNIAFCHLISVILLSISFINTNNKGWISIYGLDVVPWYQLYFWSFYWAATIMMTVGFGDFTAKIWEQAIVIGFIQIIAVMVLAYIISQVGSILYNITSLNAQLQDDLSLFHRMAISSQVPLQLRYQIESYLKESGTIKKNFEFEQQKTLLNKLPQKMRKDYLGETNKSIFMNLPFFKYLNSISLVNFANTIEGKIYYPGESLRPKKSTKLESIIILKEGKIGLCFRKKNSKYNGVTLHFLESNGQHQSTPILLNNDLFNQYKEVNYDLITKDYCFCLLLSYQNFKDGLREFKLDFEHYFKLLHSHEIIYYPAGFIINCQYCEGQPHTYFQCPKLHYLPMKSLIFLQHETRKNFPQKRSNLVARKPKNKDFNTPLLLWKNKFKVYENLWGIQNQLFQRPSVRQIDESQHFEQKKLNNLDKTVNQSLQKASQIKNILLTNLSPIIYKATISALQSYGIQKKKDDEIQIDELCNYTEYFSIANPQRIIDFPLGKTQRQKLSTMKFLR